MQSAATLRSPAWTCDEGSPPLRRGSSLEPTAPPVRGDSLRETDRVRRSRLFQELTERFEKVIRPGFSDLIRDANEALTQPHQQKDVARELLRCEAEFFWIRGLRAYARYIEPDLALGALRKKVLNPGLIIP